MYICNVCNIGEILTPMYDVYLGVHDNLPRDKSPQEVLQKIYSFELSTLSNAMIFEKISSFSVRC